MVNLCLAAVAAALALFDSVIAATPRQWAERSIYQVVTDRFALNDGANGPCVVGERKYCGGTWKGIQNKLDYIQGMGFDSVLSI